MGATIEVAYDLAGPKVWKALFGEDKLTEQDICPMQLRQVIFMQLMTHDASLREKDCIPRGCSLEGTGGNSAEAEEDEVTGVPAVLRPNMKPECLAHDD